MAVRTPDVEAAVIRLNAALDPEEIILFGSRAYGSPAPDSDIDLLIVLRSPAEAVETRESRAREALGPEGWQRVDRHLWVYTPQELRHQLRRGSTAVRDALTKGVRLSPPGGRSRYAALAKEWSATAAKETLLEKARDDLDMAEIILSTAGRRRPWWGAAFHAQQAAAKALKALIYHWGGEPERTHDLTELALSASRLDPLRGRAILLRHQPGLGHLAKHAVQPRYADAPPVSESEARAAVATAADLLADVTVRMEAPSSS